MGTEGIQTTDKYLWAMTEGSLKTKIRTFNAVLLPVLLNGATT